MDNNDYASGLKMLQEAENRAKRNNLHRQLFLVYNNMGISYYRMLEYGEALDFYLRAYTIAVKHLDEKEMMAVLNNIAILYSKEKNYPKAKEYFTQILQLAKAQGNTTRAGMYSINLGEISNKLNDPKSAEKYLADAKTFLGDSSEYIISMNTVKLQTDLLSGRYQTVIKKGLQLMSNPEVEKSPELAHMVLHIVAYAYFHLEDMENATKYITASMDFSNGEEDRIETFQLMSDISFKQKDYQKALAYKDSAFNMLESLNKTKNSNLLETGKIRFELQESKYKLQLSELQRANERRTFVVISSVVAVVALLLIWVIRVKAIKRKQSRELEINKIRINVLELEKEHAEKTIIVNQLRENETKQKLKQEQMKNEIGALNRQLTAKALIEANRSQLVEEIKSSIKGCPMADGKCQTLIRQLKETTTGNRWQEFIENFDSVNHGLLSRIKCKYPDLNANDIRFLSYVYMNLSPKEIASIFNITAEACRKRKERIKSKIGLNSEDDLNTFLYSFSEPT